MSELKRFILPDVGEGLTEAEISGWRVRPGEQVQVNQIIVDIETAKASVELPCPYDGVIGELLVSEGETVEVGTPIVTIDTRGSPDVATVGAQELTGRGAAGGTETRGAPASGGRDAGDGGGGDVLVGYGPRSRSARRRPRKASTGSGGPTGSPPREESHEGPGEGAHRPSSQGPTLAKPPVRKLARDLGIDLSSVRPTGPGGIVTRDDVSAAAREATAGSGKVPGSAPYDGAPGDGSGFDVHGEQRIPIKGVRKRTAAATVSSAFTAPHATEFLTVDATPTVEAVERIRQLPDFAEVRVNPLLLTAKALLLAVRRNPMINSTWDDEAQEILVKRYVNLSVAVAAPRGLLVPNVKEAEAMPLPQLARALADLVRTARDGTTPPEDMQGGTISITNVGAFGVDGGTPILTPGEAAILALGAIRERPWVHGGQVAPRQVVTLSLSFDHRIVDGELGARFLADIGTMLSDPTAMLAWG